MLPGALNLADRSPTPMRERAVSFGPNLQRTFTKEQPVQQLLAGSAACFPPLPPPAAAPPPVVTHPIADQNHPMGNAKQRHHQRFLAMVKNSSQMRNAPWNRPQGGKAKGKGKSKDKTSKSKSKGRKGNGQK